MESEAMKRLRLQEIKDYEGGKKCLSPSIFRKTKAPLIVGSSNSSTKASTNIDPLLKAQTSSSKKVESFLPLKDL